jgi:pimeloyl-ACP methyl ester carboxylesterase
VWGAEDRLISAHYAEDFGSLIADSRLVILPDCGHIPQVEKLPETTALIDDFLLRDTANANRGQR